MVNWAGPWGTGAYKLVEGYSRPGTRSDCIVLEVHTAYWYPARFPQLQRIVFDNTLDQHAALKLIKTREGQVDIIAGISPLQTLRVAQSPFAKVVKVRGSWVSVFGLLNMRKADSPWRDVRVRQAANFAINREDLIRYATKGNGVMLPALLPVQGFGYNPDLTPYPFAPDKARGLLREAGYPDGLSITLIATEDLDVQATVVSKMLEQSGFRVMREVLDPAAFGQKTYLRQLDRPPEQQTWDIALTSYFDLENFSMWHFYHHFALDGFSDWTLEDPALKRLYDEVLSTIDRAAQQQLIRQMERHTQEHAYFLFLYHPIQLYAVNKEVEFVPYVHTLLKLNETSVTDQHWSVRKQKAAVRE